MGGRCPEWDSNPHLIDFESTLSASWSTRAPTTIVRSPHDADRSSGDDSCVHARETVNRALELAETGMSTSAVARELGIPRATVRDWRAGRMPRSLSGDRPEPWTEPGSAEVEYCHLLGLYLGDGCISQAPRTTVLRIFFDAAYPKLIAEAVRDVRRVRPGASVHVFRQVPTNCVVVGSTWTLRIFS